MGLFKALGLATRKEKKLKENGININAIITDIAINNSLTVNGRNPRKLICEGVLPNGIKKIFESSNVSANITSDVIGQQIAVYVSPDDYKTYYVDVENYK